MMASSPKGKKDSTQNEETKVETSRKRSGSASGQRVKTLTANNKHSRHFSDRPERPKKVQGKAIRIYSTKMTELRTAQRNKRTLIKTVLADFRILKKIGKGGYGEVYLAEHIKTRKLVALKQMQKELITKTEKIEHIKNERNVLIDANSPFLISLHSSFQDAECLYLAMEYCPGGDLRALLDALQTLEESEAALYFAEMITAVHTLHNMEYIHRDLKPENFLIDAKGHLKLTDFGLSKLINHSGVLSFKTKRSTPNFGQPNINRRSLMPGQEVHFRLTNQNFNDKFTRTRERSVASRQIPRNLKPQPLTRTDRGNTLSVIEMKERFRTFSKVGSPDYMSPEVLSDQGYGEEVDWWSLGCCFFEIIMGFPPFTGDTPEAVFDNIIHWKTVIPTLLSQYKTYMSPECFSLISGLLSEPKVRLGANIDTLKNHPFFKKNNINWDKLLDNIPPFIPNPMTRIHRILIADSKV
eukprot:TRINITY_DN2669_c0_g1_i1.p1 TRINITY_DN2669_c0_g1~~TRINITY_DN2669_c0_g1_i1.p1  ORF type:complete len:468 (-),score=73.96 TRINITY_DN2669_c0_g1_i1:272-1675(-)